MVRLGPKVEVSDRGVQSVSTSQAAASKCATSELTSASLRRCTYCAAECAGSSRLGNALAFIERLPPSRAPRIVLWTVCALFAFALDLVASRQARHRRGGRRATWCPAPTRRSCSRRKAASCARFWSRDGDCGGMPGQVLVRLDPTMAGADSKSLAGDIELRRLTLRRIDAELASQTLALGKGEDTNAVSAGAGARQRTAPVVSRHVWRRRTRNAIASAPNCEPPTKR